MAARPTTIRTYETFDIAWTNDDGTTSTWSGYDRDSAERTVQYAADRGGRQGRVVRRTFEQRIAAEDLHLYKGAFVSERHEYQ